MSKVKQNKSLISTRHSRRSNITNNRMVSTILPRRSLASGVTRIHTINERKIDTAGIGLTLNRIRI